MNPPGSYKWDDLQFFLATWRARSLLGAGAALGVNASTVGRRLGALEAALDTQLFERSSEGVIPTLAAELLLPWAEGVEQSHQAFAHALSGLEREPVGKVRVTGPPGLIDHFLAPAIGELRTTFPGIQVQLDASVAYLDLSRGEADIALRGLRPTRGDLVARKLGPFDSCVVGSAAVYADRLPVDDLGGLPWVQWGDDLAHIPGAQWLAEHVPAESIVLRTSSFSAHVEAARQGAVVTLMARPFSSLSGLCPVPLTGAAAAAVADRPDQVVWLVGHQALRRVPRVAVVWEFLVALLQGEMTA